MNQALLKPIKALRLLLFFALYLLPNIAIAAATIEIDERTNQLPILSKCSVYVDEKNQYTIDDALSNRIPFEQNKLDAFTLGYIPNKSVWIKCVFKNASNTTFSKTLICPHPPTEHVNFYDSKDGYKPKQSGGFHHKSEDTYIIPHTVLTFEPNEERTVYIQTVGDIASVVARVELWNEKAYDAQNLMHQKILFLFFGAIMALMLYNLSLFFFTRDKSYLFYCLYVTVVLMHHLIYTGVGHFQLGEYASSALTRVTFGMWKCNLGIFALLFMRSFFDTKTNFPKIHKLSSIIIALLIFGILLLMAPNLYAKASAFLAMFASSGTMFAVFIAYYALSKGFQQAKFVLVGWSMVIVSFCLLALQSSGISNIITKLTYPLEISIFTEMILFSIALAARIKYLQRQKQDADALLISQQQTETIRLEKIVDERTNELKSTLSQRETLLRELHHRVKNNLQMIVSLLRLQSDATPENVIKEKFKEAESRIQAMSKAHELLYAQEDFTQINVNLYLNELTDELHQSHPNPDSINISVSGELQLPMDKAIYLGLLLNELVQNAFKHAFNDKGGNIKITLKEQEGKASFIVQDDGKGYDATTQKESLGMRLVKNIAQKQLGGKLNIDSADGTTFVLEFEI